MAEGQVLVLDDRGLLLGRLVAIVVKQVLLNRQVVVVCHKGINISGNFYRNKLKYLPFLLKQTETNPFQDPSHFRGAPSLTSGLPPHFRQTGRGRCLTRQTEPLQAAVGVLEVFDGIPKACAYEQKELMVVPAASRLCV
ncbi:Hypothetical predicted protein [Marmota monax]|uniref:60S ribosomal protein L13a n=1 Tax=Marmota monax TaxID=9995 RepID=A0A5E4C4D4_MARMO|nr:Hypothetical predicted protein [Marmota monax]